MGPSDGVPTKQVRRNLFNGARGSDSWPFSLGMKRTLRGAKGIATRSKKLLGAPGLTTRSKDATRPSWRRY